MGKFIKKAAELGGKKGAITLKERYEVSTDKLSEALDLLTIISESSRLITFLEYSLDNMEIYVEGSILVEAIPKSKKPVCEPMAGFFSGFLSELLQAKYSITELSCQAQGKDNCVFKIKKERWMNYDVKDLILAKFCKDRIECALLDMPVLKSIR